MNTTFKQLGLSNQNTVVTAWVSPDGHYAFCEMRTIEDSQTALTFLNGIQVGVYSLKIGRPKGYAGAISLGSLPSQLGALNVNSLLGAAGGITGSTNPLLAGLNSSGTGLGLGLSGLSAPPSSETLSNVIMVTNLPALISETQVKELFTSFGELKAFNVIKTAGGQTQSAVFEYVNSLVTDGVVAGMNKLEIADHRLAVQRISSTSAAVLLQPTTTVAPLPPATSAASPTVRVPPPAAAKSVLSAVAPTCVIRLSNMVTLGDLQDDELYEELLEDVADECNSHGTVKSIVIPRGGSAESIRLDGESAGKIFVQFVDIPGAKASLSAVNGRKFNGRIVEAYYYPEELFLKKVSADDDHFCPLNHSSHRFIHTPSHPSAIRAAERLFPASTMQQRWCGGSQCFGRQHCRGEARSDRAHRGSGLVSRPVTIITIASLPPDYNSN